MEAHTQAEQRSPASVVKQETEEEGNGNDDLAYGLGMLTLSGSGEPVYVGASSGVNWARVCATSVTASAIRSRLTSTELFEVRELAKKVDLHYHASTISPHPNHPA